jgi:SAM-dependent methyltransferase
MNLFLFDKKIKMLHTAPENCFVRRLKNAENIDYYSIDIQSELADDKMSLIDLQFADETFDFFYSSHVLEHIENDKKAFKEIFRVLKPNGVAIIIVPIKGEKTEEDLSVKSPELREKIYGQSDHVRIYGTDIEYRIKEEGFNVEMIKYYYTFSKFKQKYLGLSNEIIIKCVK